MPKLRNKPLLGVKFTKLYNVVRYEYIGGLNDKALFTSQPLWNILFVRNNPFLNSAQLSGVHRFKYVF